MTMPPRSRLFALSKLPPNIRVWRVYGTGLKLDLDCMAPATLEDLRVEIRGFDISAEKLCEHFHTTSLRKLTLPVLSSMDPSMWKHLPNLEVMPLTYINEFDTLELLPRKLHTLRLRTKAMRTVPLQNLPPALKKLQCALLHADDFLHLPRTLQRLRTDLISPNLALSFPSASWGDLPPQLKQLQVYLQQMDSEECFHALPETLEELDLRIGNNVQPSASLAWVERISFPKAMQASLQSLIMLWWGNPELPGDTVLPTLLSKLGQFSVLSSLSVSCRIVISSETLSNLPKSLTSLSLQIIELENFGLPLDQKRGKDQNWQNSTFSRLPEGLLTLHVGFISKHIDLNAFTMLPPRKNGLQRFLDASRIFNCTTNKIMKKRMLFLRKKIKSFC